MPDALLDLFGQVPVTIPEVDAWLRAVARIEPSSPRAARYVREWDVAEKVRAAKMRGDFDALTGEHDNGPHWSEQQA